MLSVHQVLVRPEEQDRSHTTRLRSTIVANLNGNEEIKWTIREREYCD